MADQSFSLTRPALPASTRRGHLSVIVTYLEMAAPPAHEPLRRPPGNLELVRANPPTWSFYRYLYDTVGEPWLWHERRRMPRKELERSILDPLVEVWVLHVDGTPAGFAELDRRMADTDLSYFGLIPDFIGHKLGPWLLDSAIRKAWEGGAKRLTVNTCTFDHPKALPLYQSMGFTPVRHVVREVRDPRIDGVLPRSAGTHIPIVG
ncbi:GNAT family N-acetyltransferase [Azospirillum picis]|uniref:GNAT superfamily N-acetyltransferase n=1 Tax=Azospirillum picis TaxID=488438 RepID=A0ABU0MGR0_9PROT|nr:GNAT family N-acetyltransferase [Azospirillum picis]MBP2298323.1 GNAT superfamily N-acetyltransferase [Azospirillum picis]MDQ0532628.1 GNAT superfamily N-acetyltransferase [Azospirillum picis]